MPTLTRELYFSTLFALSISFLLFSTARLLILSRYCSKVISFSNPSEVFSSPSNKISISYSNLWMTSFSSQLKPCLCSSSFARTKRSSRVSSTVIRHFSGLQYMRNWVRWNKFLLSAADGSMMHLLYILINYLSVIFLLRSSSNSQTILSIYFLPNFEPNLLSVEVTSKSVKYLLL